MIWYNTINNQTQINNLTIDFAVDFSWFQKIQNLFVGIPLATSHHKRRNKSQNFCKLLQKNSQQTSVSTKCSNRNNNPSIKFPYRWLDFTSESYFECNLWSNQILIKAVNHHCNLDFKQLFLYYCFSFSSFCKIIY